MAKTALNPRELEADVLLRGAARLQAIRDTWDGDRASLNDAIDFNRRVWVILATAMAEDDCPHDRQLRSNIANLGAFILKRLMILLATEKLELIDIIVNINRELAAGLRAAPAMAEPAPPAPGAAPMRIAAR